MDVQGIFSREAAETVNRRASLEMKHGIARLGENTPASLAAAIGHFDRAIELRRGLPLGANPFFRYGLAAGWMNQGDAFTRLGSPDNLARALHAFNTALDVLRDLPLDSNPLFRRRLAIAWQNRGIALQAQGVRGFGEAAKSFGEAITTLQNDKAAAIVDRDYLLAVAWVNQANVHAHDQESRPARAAAKHALALTLPTEASNLAMAAVGLTARHILSQAIAGIVAMENLNAAAKCDLIIEATDAADDGMVLARSWRRRGADEFRPLARQLFHFGARAYLSLQPNFLGEFLLENLDPLLSADAYSTDPTMHAVARESLERAFGMIQRHGFQMLDAPRLDSLCAQLRDLRAIEQRLDELREEHLPAG